MKFQLNVFGQTDRGLVHKENEDHFLIDATHQLYVVADGLGGLPGGALASKTAVEALAQYSANHSLDTREDFNRAFEAVNNAVLNAADTWRPGAMIATTLTVLKVTQGLLHIGHVGDSGVLMVRGKTCQQLTQDHTVAQQFLSNGSSTSPHMIAPKYHNMLTQCIGNTTPLNIQYDTLPIKTNDRIVLYTDGLSKVHTPETLLPIIQSASNEQILVESLISHAHRKGGLDNITAIAIFAGIAEREAF